MHDIGPVNTLSGLARKAATKRPLMPLVLTSNEAAKAAQGTHQHVRLERTELWPVPSSPPTARAIEPGDVVSDWRPRRACTRHHAGV